MATINGTSGDDKGNHKLTGTSAADSIYGFEGNDELFGGKGNDKLFGGKGSDKLFGEDGDDYLNGGGNSRGELDQLTGGSGKDTFSLVTNLQTIGGKPVADPGYINDDVLKPAAAVGLQSSLISSWVKIKSNSMAMRLTTRLFPSLGANLWKHR